MEKNILKMTDANGKALEFAFKDGVKYENKQTSFVYKDGVVDKKLLSYCAYELIGDDNKNQVSSIKFYDGVKKLGKTCLADTKVKYAKILEFPKTLEKIDDDGFNRDEGILDPFNNVDCVISNGNPVVEKYFRNVYHNIKIIDYAKKLDALDKKQETQELILEMTDIRGQKYKFPFVFEKKAYPYTLTYEVFEKIFEANKNIKPDEISSITMPEGVRRILVNDMTFGKNLTKINLPHSLEYLYWRGLFDKNKFPNLSFEVNGLKSFYDAESMIMCFHDDSEKCLTQGGKNSMDNDLMNNILSNQKLAEICVKKAFYANFNNEEVIYAIRQKSLFDKNHQLSKLPDNVKMQILKLWAADSYFQVSKYSINQQREKFDEIISTLPEEFRAEFDLYITELLIKRYTVSLDLRNVKIEDAKSYMFKKGIEYCEEQLKQNNLSYKKKALLHKYIACYTESLTPKYKGDKNDFSNLFKLIYDANRLEKWFSDSNYEISAFEGIMEADFRYKSISPEDMAGKCFLVGWCSKLCQYPGKNSTNTSFDEESVLPAVKKFNFDGKLNSEQRLKELYLGEGYFEGLSLNIRSEIAANMKTEQIKDICTWSNFINSIDPAQRSGEMDIAFFKSLPDQAFNFNILDILDYICGKKINIVLPEVSKDDIKIKLPVKEENGLWVKLLNLLRKIRAFFQNLFVDQKENEQFVGQKENEQLTDGEDKTSSKSNQGKICRVKVIKTETPVQIPKYGKYERR